MSCVHCQAALDDANAERCPSCRRLLRVAGRYALARSLGRGGMGEVFEGVDLENGTKVAIKVTALKGATDWKALELFERGSQTLQGLDHPTLPKVHAFVQDDSAFYQVRELYAAGSLEALVKRGLRLDKKRVHFMLKSLLETLEYLHTRLPPVLHRDVKPGNVMLHKATDLTPALVDFDTAAVTHPTSSSTTIVVSPGYTAPEQLAGEPRPASDLYSLGMTMLYVITGLSPFDLPRKDGKLELEPLLSELEPATRNTLRALVQIDASARPSSARAALALLAGRGGSELAVRAEALPAAPSLAQGITRAGASLFRISVGVLLGLIVSYILFIVSQAP
jgi:serine/threonine protein kinase